MSKIQVYVSVFVVVICAICFSFLISGKINLSNADLGRHIENGRLILSGEATKILSTNYYSYIHTDFPFINHHWAIGVVFYFVHSWAGFNGLSVLYITLALLMFLVSFGLAIKKSNLAIASVVALLFIPILVDRKEIRPEIVTYLFSLIFYAIAWLYKEKKLHAWWFSILIVLEIVWVNMHIGFPFGVCIIGAFLISELFNKDRDWKEIRLFVCFLVALVMATLTNPHFIKGALYPFFIFSNYGYDLYENTSFFQLEAWGYYRTVYVFYKITAIATWLSVLVYIIKTRDWKWIVDPLTLIMLGMTVLSLGAVRNLILFAIFGLPYCAYTIYKIIPSTIWSKKIVNFIAICTVIILVASTIGITNARTIDRGIGLMPGVDKSIEFFKTNNLHGPIFNNYDIGSYLVYGLKGQEKVFVENRPEAYPASFFSDVYIPAQNSDEAWKELDKRYGFKVVWFYRHDLTQWGKTFLNTRSQDKDWTMVYLDNYAVMFLRNTAETDALIEKYKKQSD